MKFRGFPQPKSTAPQQDRNFLICPAQFNIGRCRSFFFLQNITSITRKMGRRQSSFLGLSPPLPAEFQKPSFLLYHHPHSLASLTASFCVEIAKAAHPDARAHIIQIEVVLDENGSLPREYLNTNSSGAVRSYALPRLKDARPRADHVTRFLPWFVLHPRLLLAPASILST